jgi:hypothetical protein
MSTFTNVPDSVLEPGDPIRSVDIIAIKNNAIFLKDGISYSIINEQIFNTSGTWTRPAGVDLETDSLVALVIGGGGSGGANRGGGYSSGFASANGGGCSAAVFASSLFKLPTSLTITVGSGGASRTVTSGGIDGITGGTSSIANGATILAAVTGGTGGFQGSNQTDPTDGSIETAVRPLDSGLFRGKPGRKAYTGGGDVLFPQPLFGGGGGAGTSVNIIRTTNQAGGPAFGFIGAGGTGSSTTATAGGAGGGGGGGAAHSSGTCVSGAGGTGRVVMFTVRGLIVGGFLANNFVTDIP